MGEALDSRSTSQDATPSASESVLRINYIYKENKNLPIFPAPTELKITQVVGKPVDEP